MAEHAYTLNQDQSPNLPVNADNVLTMSSREIAELVDSRHDNVKRTIERLVSRSVIVQPPMEDEQTIEKTGRFRVEKVYKIGKRDSFVGSQVIN